MKNIEIFDPAMCCSTGVCGPSIDPNLMRVATLVNALAKKGIVIKRHNLSSEPQDFVSNKLIGELLSREGADVLPITLANGEVVKTREYPTNEEFSQWLGVRITAAAPRRKGGCSCGNGGCC